MLFHYQNTVQIVVLILRYYSLCISILPSYNSQSVMVFEIEELCFSMVKQFGYIWKWTVKV
jgi:hypothetical protein